MKKFMIAAFAALMLVGCGSKTNDTVCTKEEETYTFKTDKDKMLVGIHYAHTANKADLKISAEEVVKNLTERSELLSGLEGVKYSFKDRGKSFIYEYDIDVSKVDSSDRNLIMFYLTLGPDFAKQQLNSLVENVKTNGFECKQ